MQASLSPLLRVFLSALVLLGTVLSPSVSAQTLLPAQGGANHIAANLVAEAPVEPGGTLDVALVFRPEDGWHGYWSNPGDAGYGMVLDWHLPEGWEAGAPQYPVPERLLISGLMNHVYEGEYAVLVPILVPEDAAVMNLAPITLDAEWLACTDEICVPESATLTLRLPDVAIPEMRRRFDTYRAQLPPLLDAAGAFEVVGETLHIAIPLPASVAVREPHVFIADKDVVDYAAPQSFRRNGDRLVAEIALGRNPEIPDSVTGIVAIDGARDGLRFHAEPGIVPNGGERLGGSAASGSLLLLAGGALLGGLLLNLMPCVFPILSLKALTLARAGESEAQARREGLAYTAGTIIACLALGAAMLALRAAGEQVGWAFQLQQPAVVVALLVLAVAITANLAGLFELPSVSITRAGGKSSAFVTGLLAAFVATPCTGPFMAAALGAALVLPPAQALLLFAALGLGLALPFLLLGFVPALRSRLPKPGPWMERFRKAMAIPMGLTALALVWLVARLGGQGFALIALVLVFGLVVALMIVGRLQRRGKLAWPVFGLVIAPFVIFAGIGLPASFDEAAPSGEDSILDPVPFDEFVLMDTVQSQGKPVFLWFTADWCLTCKVNESVAIEREATREAFEAAGVVAMRGDWTRRDAEIARFLEEQGVAGVPLYLWYPAGGAAPEQLPQVLTPDMLIERAQRP